MNSFPHTMMTLLVMCCFTICSFAQPAYNDTNTNNDYLAYNNVRTEASEIYSPYRFHKKISGTHTGYVIELAASNLPLGRKAPIFRQFGNVYYHKLSEGGYSYIIQTSFSEKESLEKFFTNIIQPKNTDARMIQYKEGKRTILQLTEAVAKK